MLTLHFLYKLGSCTIWAYGKYMATGNLLSSRHGHAWNSSKALKAISWHSVYTAAVAAGTGVLACAALDCNSRLVMGPDALQVLNEDILPALEKLRTERSQYMQWQAASAQQDRLKRFCVAYQYHQAEQCAPLLLTLRSLSSRPPCQ